MNKVRTTSVPEHVVLQPLAARSIVLSVLLGSHPPAMRVAPILEFTSLFGISNGAVRTALSRMVASGDLDSANGIYRLSKRLRVRQSQQDAGRSTPTGGWNGDWWFAAVLSDRRSVAERRDFRSRAVGARFGELRPDIWMRPANIDAPTNLPDVVLTRGPLVIGHDREIVRRLWNLEVLAARTQQHILQLDRVSALLSAPHDDTALASTFTSLAACLRFLRTEPQLPAQLTDSSSIEALRPLYDDAESLFQNELAAYFQQREVSTTVQ